MAGQLDPGRPCEAAAMDAAAMLGADDTHPIPPCDEPGEVEVQGYRGCADALDAIAAFGESAQRRGAFSQVIRRFLGRG